MKILWLALFVLFLVTEASTVTVVSVWFALGSLAALLLSALGAQIWLQIVVFFVVSGLFLFLLRPVVRKYFTPRIQKTNADAVVDSIGVVTEDIDNVKACGRIKLGAMEWAARSTTGEPISAGVQAKVDRIEGVKVYVTPVNVQVNA